MNYIKENGKKIMVILGGILIALATGWYAVFGLKPYEVTSADIELRYAHQTSVDKKSAINMKMTQLTDTTYSFTYTSFDGAVVNGRVAYPQSYQAEQQQKMPVMLGIHAMSRSESRWWVDSFKERATLEQTHKITQQALANGYAIFAIDSRNHGQRKDLDNTIFDIMNNMDFFGEREPYENMIVDTVKDYRVLVDWLDQQPNLDPTKTAAVGYSMGGQVSLLLAAVDNRIENVISIVPPALDSKTAIVAPSIIAKGLNIEKLWLVTANDDEYTSKSENKELFDLIATKDKKHITFDSDHLLPEGYYQQLTGWYE